MNWAYERGLVWCYASARINEDLDAQVLWCRELWALLVGRVKESGLGTPKMLHKPDAARRSLAKFAEGIRAYLQ